MLLLNPSEHWRPHGGREERTVVDHDLAAVRRGNASVRHALGRDRHGRRCRTIPLVDRVEIDLVRRAELETGQKALVLHEAVAARLRPDRGRVEAEGRLRLSRHVGLPGDPCARRGDGNDLGVGDLEWFEWRCGRNRRRAAIDRDDDGGAGCRAGLRGLACGPACSEADLHVGRLLRRHPGERTNARRRIGDRRRGDRAVQPRYAHELGRWEVGGLRARCECGCRHRVGPLDHQGDPDSTERYQRKDECAQPQVST